MVWTPYQAVYRLFALAIDRWAEIDGECAGRGINPLRLRFDRFLNLVYFWYVSRVEDKGKFDTMLIEPMVTRRRAARTRPAAPAARAADLTEEEEGAGFMAFLGEHQQFAATHRSA